MNFLSELQTDLNEARMWRRLSIVDGMSVHHIGERLFSHLLALQILAHEDPDFASAYAKKVVSNAHFDGFRGTLPDLFNIITLIIKQERYSYMVVNDSSVILPELRLRRCLRAVANKRLDNIDYTELLLWIQRKLPDLPGLFIQFRRQVSNWKRVHSSDKKIIINRLMLNMREITTGQSDLYVALFELSKRM